MENHSKGIPGLSRGQSQRTKAAFYFFHFYFIFSLELKFFSDRIFKGFYDL